jgi:predicted O-methyltransferase YrrM
MDKAVQTVLSEYEVRAEIESKRMHEMDPAVFAKHLDEFLLAVGPATGQLMNLLIKQAKSKRILEVGASFGYSTLWLAEAARETGGKVISLEIRPEKQQYARAALTKAGLVDFVDFRLGDVLETIPVIKESVDFVLLDVWKDIYIPCLDLFYPKLSPGAFIAADNMIFPENARAETSKYRDYIRGKPHIQTILLPVGSGIELSRYTRGAEIV